MTTYDRIIELCKEHGVKQTVLEKELGFGRGSIGKMKQYGTSYDRLKKIADYFNVPVSYLSGENDNKYMTVNDIIQENLPYRIMSKYDDEISKKVISYSLMNEINPTPAEMDILLAYRNLDKEQKRLILYALKLNELADKLDDKGDKK